MKSIAGVCRGPRGALAKLVDYSQFLQNIARHLHACLPGPLNQHVEVANVREGRLVLHTDTSAWASRLHFFTPQILSFCRHDPELGGLHVEKVQIKVRPLLSPPTAQRAKPVLSQSAADTIRHVAENMPDSALQAALLRLAANRDKNGEKA